MIIEISMDWIYKEFGLRLRSARKAAQLTQEALAERVNMSRTSITNIEKGRQHIPIHTLFKLATAVGLPPARLLPRQQIEPEPRIRKLLEETGLEKEGLAWVTQVVTSGIDPGENNEPNRK